jgi:hypothetical protein
MFDDSTWKAVCMDCLTSLSATHLHGEVAVPTGHALEACGGSESTRKPTHS